MINKKKLYVGQHLIAVFMLLSIVLIAFLTYGDILSYFFTGMDVIPLIDSAKVQSFDDVVRIFSEPGMNAIPDAVNFHKWYRPISVLSFSLDYSIWKLNPFGYHLTDLILHIMVSVLVFILIKFLTNGSIMKAWLGALLFTTHPLLIESIPANVRRMDTMATLFMILSLLLTVKYLSTVSRNAIYMFLSVFSYALAIFSKEVAVILPALVFTYSVINNPDKSHFRYRVADALKVCIPFFIVTLTYLASRIYVLKGIGGYSVRPHGIYPLFLNLIDIFTNYFVNLVYPVDFLSLNSLFSPISSNSNIIKFVLSLSLMCLFIFYNRSQKSRDLINSSQGKIIIFAIIWVLLPLCVYLFTLISGRYYLYIAVIPLSIILSVCLSDGFKTIVRKIRKDSFHSSLSIKSAVLQSIIIAGMITSFLIYSPLIRTYGEWKDSGEIVKMFLGELSKIVHEIPEDAVLRIHNFPSDISSYEDKVPHAREVEYPVDYSIKSWLDLNCPDKRIKKIVIHNNSRLSIYPNHINLDMKEGKDNDFMIFIEYKNYSA